jgi:hypothetical protein
MVKNLKLFAPLIICFFGLILSCNLTAPILPASSKQFTSTSLLTQQSILTTTIEPVVIPYPSPPQLLLPDCSSDDLYLVVDTEVEPLKMISLVVVLYPKKYLSCHFETRVNFKLEDKSGNLLEIQGNNGVAFSSGNVIKTNSIVRGVGAIWDWENFCPKPGEKDNIVLIGVAGEFQKQVDVRKIPICLDSKTGSRITFYPTFSESVEWLGTATPPP